MASSTQDGSTISATKKPLYEASTQFKNWRYSFAKLAEVRTRMNDAAVAAIREKIEADEPGSSQNVLFLTPIEELLLVKLYITKITQLCGLFRFPEEVEATAITYLKRFYLRNTVMDWHPKNVMLTALFLATKTANFPISLETYTKHIPKTEPSDVLDLEFLVAQSLGFEFAVWHAHRALWGIWLDVQTLPDPPAKLQPSVYDATLNYVRASRLTDAELVFTPAQIALAAFSLVEPDLASRWSHSKKKLDHTVGEKVIEDIKALILSKGQAPDVESVREVDRRLKVCKNPEKVVGSKPYLAKKAEEEKRAEERRNKKVNDVNSTTMEDTDPFGNEVTKSRRGLVDYDDDDDD